MMGYNDPVTRRLCRAFGAATTVTEMLKPEQLLRNCRSLRGVLTVVPGEEPRGAQIACGTVREAAEAAAWVEARGFAYVDLNFGCPLKKERRRGRGSAVLGDPRRVEALTRAAVEAVAIPVSVKIRSGPGQGEVNVAEVSQAAEQGGALALCVHGRAADAPYDAPSPLAPIRVAREAVPGLMLLGNGDILEPGDALRMVAETGCDGVVIGRGMVGNPWLLRRCREVLAGRPDPGAPAPEAVFAQARRHARELVEVLGPKKGLRFAIRYGHYYIAGFAEVTAYREQARRLGRSLASFEEGLAALEESVRSRFGPARHRRFERGWEGSA